jgi:hypothetical protein
MTQERKDEIKNMPKFPPQHGGTDQIVVEVLLEILEVLERLEGSPEDKKKWYQK